ncbi:putative F-box/FBD/LRR-repeat protein At4g03220 isoform X3 [Miscanthus floridulus]|uniref:putative F-box/FBD/LRR-repeat protein At4g03220 isoform X3 n=1 Tax=Miscanthus floridulus TaxID=154761 RepID=UPI00345923CC
MALQCGGGGGGGGGIAANLAKAKLSFCADGEDRLSALPYDLLVDILLRLVTTAEAARTSVLARRWRSLWALLPELRFHFGPDGHRIRELLDDPEAADLRRISVTTTEGSGPDSASASAWLPAAARRLAGGLVYHNMVPRSDGVEEDAGRGGGIELPCFEKATTIELRLGFLGLFLPSSGTFARRADLSLYRLQLHGPCELGEVVSWPRCPRLQKLRVCQSLGLDNLSIHSKSLPHIKLESICGLRQLTIVTPTLKQLEVSFSLLDDDPSVHISAPQLESLVWLDLHHPRSVHLGNLEQLGLLGSYFLVYGQHDNREPNHHSLRLLQRFQVLNTLVLWLIFQKVSGVTLSGNLLIATKLNCDKANLVFKRHNLSVHLAVFVINQQSGRPRNSL